MNACHLCREQIRFGLSCLSSVIDLTSFRALLLQVSLRYHCRLYNEWRQTNQRVVLLLPKSHSDSMGNPSVTGLLSVKRPSKESIVWLVFFCLYELWGLSWEEGPWIERRNSDAANTDSLVGFWKGYWGTTDGFQSFWRKPAACGFRVGKLLTISCGWMLKTLIYFFLLIM